jgi:pimeloyl-ACP methyl ester carboxylesterase
LSVRIEANGRRFWFDVDGPALVPDGPTMRERPTVLLLHGGPGSFDHSYFKPDFARLAEAAQIVYLDLPGHGRSDHGDAESWTFESCADGVRDFCRGVGLERPVVYGHSLGGMVAMVLAARHPDLPSAVVLQSAPGRFDLPALVEELRRLGGDEVALTAARVYGGDSESVTDEAWARCWKLFGPHVVEGDERSRGVLNADLNVHALPLLAEFDALDRVGAIACPTLVCTGELDPAFPPRAARELAVAIPDARLEVLPDAGHFPWKDVPDRYWPLLLDFVGKARDRAPVM